MIICDVLLVKVVSSLVVLSLDALWLMSGYIMHIWK